MSRVTGTLNGHPFRSNLVKMGGRFLLGVHKANVEALGLYARRHRRRSSCRSTPSRAATTPRRRSSRTRCGTTPSPRRPGTTLAPSHRREYVGFIKEAKKEETRARRVQRTIDELAGRNPKP